MQDRFVGHFSSLTNSSFRRRLLPLTVALISLTFSSFGQGFLGEPGCDYTPCVNPVPCAFCTGDWHDDYGGTWDITSTGGTVSGTVFVDLMAINGCPNQTYTVSGTFTSNNGNASVNGSNSISLTASSPSPGAGGSGCVIASSVSLSGSIENNGCDLIGPSDASLVSSSFGSFTTNFSKASEIPTGETSTDVGWASGTWATISQWRQVLTGSYAFDGRQVNEAATDGSNFDTCYFDGSAYDPYGLTGGWWNVAFYGTTNQWVDDYVGFTTDAVTYYRNYFRPSCSANAAQEMDIATQGTSGNVTSYTFGNVGAGIPNYTTVSSSRDGSTVTLTWP